MGSSLEMHAILNYCANYPWVFNELAKFASFVANDEEID